MKITLGIPCHAKDLGFLPELIDIYQKSECKPDEIVVSICGSKQSPIKESSSIKIMMHEEVIPHGPNRQIVFQESCGDVILYQDADDIPYPDRLRIVKECFMSRDIAVLNHFWIPTTYEFKGAPSIDSLIKVDRARWFPNNIIEDMGRAGGYGGVYGPVHGGNLAVSRNVFSSVRWKDWHELRSKAEDCEFFLEALFNFDKSYVLPFPLIKYRHDDIIEDFKRNHPEF